MVMVAFFLPKKQINPRKHINIHVQFEVSKNMVELRNVDCDATKTVIILLAGQMENISEL